MISVDICLRSFRRMFKPQTMLAPFSEFLITIFMQPTQQL